MRISKRDEERRTRVQALAEVARRELDAQRLALDHEKLSLDRAKLLVDTLLKEHKNRFDEVIFHSARYHKQVNFIQLYLTVVGSFIAVLFSKDWAPVQQSLSADTVTALKSTLLSIAAVISLYLFTNVMDALYAIYMNGRRLADLEQRVNSTLGAEAVTWDSRIVPKLYSIDKFFIGAWVRPNILVGFWSFTFFIGVSIGLCAAAYVLVEPFFYYFTPVVLFFASVTMLNWLLLHREGLRFIDAAVTGLDHTPNRVSLLYLIIVANVLLGYLPMLLFSIRDGALCGPPHAFPFCSLTSVAIGDLILIPFVAYQALLYLRHFAIADLRLIIAFSLAISGAGTFYLHKTWIADQYTGFMDIVLGHLSSAGIVHALYTFVHTTLIAVFILVLVIMRPIYGEPAVRKSAVRALTSLTIFFALGIVDATWQHFRVFSGAWGNLLSAVWPSLFPPLLASILLWRTAKLSQPRRSGA